jgi:hypothetical protein
MSIKVSVYAPAIGKEVLPLIVSRLREHGMECQFQPGFALDALKDAGMVSLRLRVRGQGIPQYENVEMLSEFEISFKDFRYSAPVSVNPRINEKLKSCTTQVVIRMHARPTSSVRSGMYFAVFLSDTCGGVVYNPRVDQYLEPAQALAELSEVVRKYEMELSPEDWVTLPFSEWPKR